jgi:hypothetical protein
VFGFLACDACIRPLSTTPPSERRTSSAQEVDRCAVESGFGGTSVGESALERWYAETSNTALLSAWRPAAESKNTDPVSPDSSPAAETSSLLGLSLSQKYRGLFLPRFTDEWFDISNAEQAALPLSRADSCSFAAFDDSSPPEEVVEWFPAAAGMEHYFSRVPWDSSSSASDSGIRQRPLQHPAEQRAQFNIPEPIEEDAETTAFDLYLSDKYQGLILARFTDNWFEILEPTDVIEQLPPLKDQENVMQLLRGRIQGERILDGIGSVRMDLGTFRIIIRLNEDNFINTKKKLNTVRIGEPESGLAFRQDLRTTYAGELDDEFSGALNHRTMLSYGKLWADADGTYVEHQDYELDTLSGNGIFGDSRVGLGYLRTTGQRFAGSVDFLGISASTAEEIFLDEEALRGSRLEIFIPSRSRVDFYRGGRLLTTQILDFGMQLIDTSRFPQGSYDVEIVITEGNGEVTRERRFFTKSGQLSITDYPLYDAQLGYLRDKFKPEPIPVYQLGLTYRALSFLQVEGSVYGTDELAIGSTELTGLYHDYYFSGGVAQSTQGKTGLSADLTGSLFGINFGGFYSGTVDTTGSNLEQPVGPTPTPTPDEDELHPRPPSFVTTIEEEQQLNNIASARQTINGYIYKQIGQFEARFVANRNKRDQEETRYAWGPIGIWRILEGASDTVRLELSFLRTEDGEQSSAFLSYIHRFSPWTINTQLQSGKREAKAETRELSSLEYDTKNRAGLGTRARLSNETVARDGDLSTNNSLEIRHVANRIDGAGFIRDQEGDNSSTSLGANLDAALIRGNHGGVSLSYPAEGDAILIAELTTHSAGMSSEMIIMVNGSEYGRLMPGSQMVIGLAPYHNYRISIKPAEGSELIDYDVEPYDVTLFPGNIVRKTWSVEHVFIALGRIVDDQGNPLPHERLKGFKGYVVTEDDGTFQAEANGTEAVEINSKNRHCRLTLPEISTPEYYHEYGDLTCRNILP